MVIPSLTLRNKNLKIDKNNLENIFIIILIMNYEKYIQHKQQCIDYINEHKSKIAFYENELISLETTYKTVTSDEIISHFNLSPIQLEVVNATEDYILVIACAGSGKTHTLIARYVNLITKKIYNPEQVVLITFTRKAGSEMSSRLELKLDPTQTPNYVGSLHGLSYRILSNEKILHNNTVIIDDEAKLSILHDIINNTEYTPDIKHILNIHLNKIIDQSCCYYPIDIKSVLVKLELERYSKEVIQCIKEYNKIKKQHHQIDYNDLMVMFCDWLKTPKSNTFKSNIKYIFFDEYQDINPIQNWILLELSKTTKMMVIGDDDQSIYAFRGSSVKYILGWNFENSKIYKLGQNYRSNENIVKFSSNILKHNTKGYEKEIYSTIKSDNKPLICQFTSQKEQYVWIAEDIKMKIELGIKPHEIAILARSNYLLNNIELELANINIKYTKNQGGNILDKFYVKDFLAFVVIIINPSSIVHWKRIISSIIGLDMNDANHIVSNGNDMIKNIKDFNEKVKIGSLTYLLENYEKLETLYRTSNIYSFLKHCQTMVEYISGRDMNAKKLQILNTDLTNLIKYLKNGSITDMLSNIYLNKDIETNTDNLIWLNTFHGSKGLEWKVVYLIDMTSRDFPKTKSKYWEDVIDDIEEERRLFYVASSRAKSNLIITFWSNMDNKSKKEIITSSPFLLEINPELYEFKGDMNRKMLYVNNLYGDMSNYICINGYYKLVQFIKKLKIITIKDIASPSIYELFDIELVSSNKPYISKFLSLLVGKMLVNNYIMDDIDLEENKPIVQELVANFSDNKIDWQDSLNLINKITLLNCIDENKIGLILESNFNKYYKSLEQLLKKLIGKKVNKINYRTQFIIKGIECCLDIQYDNSLILLIDGSLSFQDIGVGLLKCYMANKIQLDIKNLIWLNVTNLKTFCFEVNKEIVDNFKKLIYY